MSRFNRPTRTQIGSRYLFVGLVWVLWLLVWLGVLVWQGGRLGWIVRLLLAVILVWVLIGSLTPAHAMPVDMFDNDSVLDPAQVFDLRRLFGGPCGSAIHL